MEFFKYMARAFESKFKFGDGGVVEQKKKDTYCECDLRRETNHVRAQSVETCDAIRSYVLNHAYEKKTEKGWNVHYLFRGKYNHVEGGVINHSSTTCFSIAIDIDGEKIDFNITTYNVKLYKLACLSCETCMGWWSNGDRINADSPDNFVESLIQYEVDKYVKSRNEEILAKSICSVEDE